MRKKLPVPLLVDNRGYVLYANPDGTYTMGCREKFTPAQCFKHWGGDYFNKYGDVVWESRKTRAAEIRKAVRDHQRGLPVKLVVMAGTPFFLEIEYADLTNVIFPKKVKSNCMDLFLEGCHFDGEELVLPANLESVRITGLTTTKEDIYVVIGKHTKINW